MDFDNITSNDEFVIRNDKDRLLIQVSHVEEAAEEKLRLKIYDSITNDQFKVEITPNNLYNSVSFRGKSLLWVKILLASSLSNLNSEDKSVLFFEEQHKLQVYILPLKEENLKLLNKVYTISEPELEQLKCANVASTERQALLVALCLQGPDGALSMRLGIQVPKVIDKTTSTQKKRKIRDILPDVANLKKDSRKYNSARKPDEKKEVVAKFQMSDMQSKINNLIDVIFFDYWRVFINDIFSIGKSIKRCENSGVDKGN